MSVTVKSLKKENDSLKLQIEDLTKDFQNLEENLTKKFHQQQKLTTSRQPGVDAETEKHLDFYSKSYDDLNRFKADAIAQLQQHKSRLDALSNQVEAIASAIEESQRYSYRYNVKITGIPDEKPSESAIETTAICVNLFKKLGIEISDQDIDISHRVSTRNARAGPRPIICKFSRRIVKEQVMKLRKNACKVRAVDLGLRAEGFLDEARILDHLTPQVQKLLAETKKYQLRKGFRFCWVKNFTVYLRESEDSQPIQIKTRKELENIMQRENSPGLG